MSERVQEWVVLAEEVVAHEFPSWHLFAAFEVFHLSDKETDSDGHVLRNLERLAKAFKVSPDKLKKEFTQMQPIATALKKSAGLTNREAWRQAVLRVGERRKEVKAGTSALFNVLAGYQAWTASSSGVEQLFSRLKNSPTEQGQASLETERRIAATMGDSQVRDGQTADVVSEARRIYCSLLRSGISRAQTRKRFDGGRKGVGRKGTLAEWNRKRKRSLSAALDDLTTPPRQATAALATESTVKERNFQRQKTLKRKAEALNDGLLLMDEITPAVQAQATKMAKANKQSDRQRKKKRAEYVVAAKMTSKKKSNDWGCQNLPGPAWLDPRLGHESATVQQKLLAFGVDAVCEDCFLNESVRHFGTSLLKITQ